MQDRKARHLKRKQTLSTPRGLPGHSSLSEDRRSYKHTGSSSILNALGKHFQQNHAKCPGLDVFSQKGNTISGLSETLDKVFMRTLPTSY